jgi:CheY-like chemotaxis protein
MSKILLVEDDNNLREIYEARLTAEGYEVLSAHDGEEALVVAKDQKPDLVISDVMMPKISGFEMLDILRNTPDMKDVKVIMLTALGQTDDQQRADKLGANRYLVKSQVTLEDIVKVAHEVLSSSETSAPNNLAGITTSEPTTPAAMPVVADDPITVTPEPPLDPVTDLSINKSINLNEIAESVEDESKKVESQIENFASTQSTESPLDPVTPTVSGNQAINDGLMDDTLSSLLANTDISPTTPAAMPVVTEPVAAPSEPVVADDPITVTPEPPQDPTTTLPNIPVTGSSPASEDNQSAAPVSTPIIVQSSVTPAPSEADRETEPASSNNVIPQETRKKIIEPISDLSVKPSINELLAQEEAKEVPQPTSTVPAATSTETSTLPTPEEAGTPEPNTLATPPVTSEDIVDPNSIAL